MPDSHTLLLTKADREMPLRYDLMAPHVFLRDSSRIYVPTKRQDVYASPNPITKIGELDGVVSTRFTVRPRLSASSGLGEVKDTAEKKANLKSFARSHLVTLQPQSELRANVKAASRGVTLSPGREDSMLQKHTIPPARRQASESLTKTSTGSRTFFKIHRRGAKLATVKFMRPTWRLGETIPLLLDFRGADTTCHAFCASLETIEEVDASIALRSSSSIARATRRVHAQVARSSTSSEITFLELAIPRNSAPDFQTSGISMRWVLRLDFTTSSVAASCSQPAHISEVVSIDERALVSSAIQELSCEHIDVLVPLRIHGSWSDNYDADKRVELSL